MPKLDKNDPVLIVILTWNNLAVTIDCLTSVKKLNFPSFKILVVDNGSTDATVTTLRQSFPDILLIENKKNLGYAHGNNIGIEFGISAGYKYIFVINNDIILDSECLLHLYNDLQLFANAAAASPKIYYYDNPSQIYFAGGKIGASGKTVHIGDGELDSEKYTFSSNSEWLTGCAILFKTDALVKVGYFDTKYHLLFEDSDWSLRARRLGYSLRLVPSALIWHKVSASFGKSWSYKYLYYFTRNNLLFIEKNFPLSKRPLLFYYSIRRSRRYMLRGVSEELPKMRRAFVAGIYDYIMRHFGEKTV